MISNKFITTKNKKGKMKMKQNEFGHHLEGWTLTEAKGIKYLRKRFTSTSILIELPQNVYVYELGEIISVTISAFDYILKFYSDACTMKDDGYYNYLFFKEETI